MAQGHPPNYLKHNSYEKEYSRSLKDLDLVYEDNPDSIPSLEQLYAMLLETLEKLPETIDCLRAEFKKCLPLLLFILGCGGS